MSENPDDIPQKSMWSVSDVIVRTVGAVMFTGTLINMIYGIVALSTESAASASTRPDPMIVNILPFFIVGLFGIYLA